MIPTDFQRMSAMKEATLLLKDIIYILKDDGTIISPKAQKEIKLSIAGSLLRTKLEK